MATVEMHAPFQHILVPTDGSQPSVTAGRLAVQLAVLHKAHVTFVYVIDEIVVGQLAGVSGKTTRQVQSDLEITAQHYLDYLSHIASECYLTSDHVICYGVPYQEITNLARKQGVDLIAIGEMGGHGVLRLVGSITERVVEHAPCSVLVVK